MRRLVIALGCGVLLAGCDRCGGSGGAADHAGTWWCWEGSVCWPTEPICRARLSLLDTPTECVAQPEAYCRFGCQRGRPTEAPACDTTCVTDRQTCEEDVDLTGGRPCRAERPPANPDLYPHYLEPGWWCFELPTLDGAGTSHCTKAQEECDWFLDRALESTGWSRASVPGAATPVACCRRDGEVHCYSQSLPDDRGGAFSCSLALEHCELKRQLAQADDALARRDTRISECAAWRWR